MKSATSTHPPLSTAPPIVLTLPYPPSANRYWRNVNGAMVVSREAKNFKERVWAVCLESRTKPIAGDVSVVITVFRARKIGDLDNTIKVLLDSLIGLAFADDSQVAVIHASRREDKENPRAVVQIRPLPTVEHYVQFKEEDEE